MSLVSHPVFAARFQGTQWVEASAGSGKTWTVAGLVARAVVERGVPLESVLVTTFTEAAAAELKARVRDKLLRLAAALERPGAPVGDLFCETLAAGLSETARTDAAASVAVALASADRLSATTIHGFCSTVIREFGLAAALPQDARLEPDTSTLVRRAVLALLHELAGEAPVLARALAAGGEDMQADDMVALLEHREAVVLHDPDACEPHELVPTATRWEAVWQAARDAWLAQGPATTARLLELAEAKRLDGRRWQVRWIASGASHLDAFLGARCAWSAPEPNTTALARFATDMLREGTKSGAPWRDACTDALQDLLDCNTYRRRIAGGMRRFVRERGFEAVDAAKRRERVMDFDDLVRCVARAVQAPDGAALAARLRERWPVAFVDEAQDTDPLQWVIFGRIWRDGTLFVVGDPKQAIYGFRGADLDTYLTERERVPDRHELPQNRRSSAGYVAAVNALFGAPGRAAFLDSKVRYLQAPASERPPGALLDADGAPLPPLRVRLPAPAEPPSTTAGRADLLAALAADEIAALLAGGAWLEPQAGCAPEARRRLQACDVAVLVARREDGQRMARALRERGVGAVQVGDGSVLASGEAADLRCLLAAIEDRADDDALRAAVATPLLSDGPAAVMALRAEADGSDAAREAWRERFARCAQDWAQRGPLPALRRLLAACGTPARLAGFSDGERRLTNLAHLCELLQDVQPPLRGAGAARRWLLAHRDDRGDVLMPRLESDDDLVRISTIHKAKGLEYPVVFLPFASNASMQARPRPSWCEGGVRTLDLRLRTQDDKKVPIGVDGQAFVRRARHQEQVRLAYVALTRAVHHCCILWLPDGRGKGAAGTRLSPFAWLLHGSDTPVDAAGQPEPLPEESVWRERLAALAARASGCIEIAEAPPPVDLQALPARAPAPVHEARRFGASMPPARVRLSYTGIVARPERLPEDEDAAARDRDADAAPAPVEPPAVREDGTEPPRRLSGGGTAWGHCLHAVLETVDLTAPVPEDACAQALRRWGFDARVRAAEVAAWLDEVLDARVPVERACPRAMSFTLREAARARAPLRELEFDLSLSADVTRLAAALAPAGQVALEGERLAGLLRGFIDAVFVHEGRVWVIDWKSNALPAFDAAALREAMDTSGYRLQGLLYCVAMRRLLRARGGGLALGGIVYAFLRGVGGQDGAGFHVEAFDEALLDAACRALDDSREAA